MGAQRSIPLASADKLLYGAGAIRISHDARQKFHIALMQKSHTIAQRAVILSAHANRTTVLAEDIDLAVQELLNP